MGAGAPVRACRAPPHTSLVTAPTRLEVALPARERCPCLLSRQMASEGPQPAAAKPSRGRVILKMSVQLVSAQHQPC